MAQIQDLLPKALEVLTEEEEAIHTDSVWNLTENGCGMGRHWPASEEVRPPPGRKASSERRLLVALGCAHQQWRSVLIERGLTTLMAFSWQKHWTWIQRSLNPLLRSERAGIGERGHGSASSRASLGYHLHPDPQGP